MDEVLVNNFLEHTNPVAYHVNSWLEAKYPGIYGELTSGLQSFSNQKSILKIPEGLTQEQFTEISQLLRDKVGHISQDIFVQGSRAKGTAKAVSDIDIGIRVSAEKFEQMIKDCFGTPKTKTSKWKTMMHAIETGKIQRGEIKLPLKPGEVNMSTFGDYLGAKILNKMKVDISIIKSGGSFDTGPFMYII